MINLAEVVNDPDFAQQFSIIRSQGGSFDSTGTWQGPTVDVPMYGIIQPASADELELVPEGDRVKEVKSFHSSQPMFITHENSITDTNQGTSDVCVWHGQQYRLIKLFDWEDFGYYKALGVIVSGTVAPTGEYVPSVSTSGYSDGEVVNGNGTNWVLANMPNPATSLQLFVREYENGPFVLLRGYSLNGNVLTTQMSYGAGTLIAWYRY